MKFSFDVLHLFRTLKYRNYKLFFTGQGISLIGTWIQIIAMNWLVYELSGSAFVLGVVGFLSRFPILILSPFAGVLADRKNRYKLLILTQIFSMIQAAILTILVFAGTIQVWHIFILGTFLGVINAFDTPIRQSFISDIVEKKEDLSNAIALNSVLFNTARLIGPSIAGIILATVGEGWCFLLNTLSFVAILITLMFMKVPPQKIIVSVKSPLKEFKDGFIYVYRNIPIRIVLLVLAVVSLMGMSFQVLMPIFAKDVLNGQAHTLGFLMSAVGLGAVTGGIMLASRKSIIGLGRVIAISTTIFSISLILFAISRSQLISMFLLYFTGLGMITQMASSNTIIQTLTDENMRGRVMSFYTIAFMGTVPFGNLFAGILAGIIGETYTVMLSGISSLFAAIYFYYKLPEIRKYAKPIIIKKNLYPPSSFPEEL